MLCDAIRFETDLHLSALYHRDLNCLFVVGAAL